MSDPADLATWLKPHVTAQQDEDGEPRPRKYLRLKTGSKSRRLANDTYLTELEITGLDASTVANEVAGAIADYASADPTWVEILEVGSGTVRSVKRIDADKDGEATPAVVLDPNSMMSALVVGITSSNATLSGRINHLESELTNSTNARIDLAGKAAMAETLLIVEREKAAWMAEHAGNDEFGAALQLLGPMLAPIGSVLASKAAEMAAGGARKKKPEAAPDAAAAPETAGDRADRLIAEVLDLADKEPDVLRARTPQLLALGMRIQGLITSQAAA